MMGLFLIFIPLGGFSLGFAGVLHKTAALPPTSAFFILPHLISAFSGSGDLA